MPEDALFMGRYPARSREREQLRVVLTERQQGKTTQLVEWLLGGEPIDAWPSWSRVLIVHDSRRLTYILDHFRAEQQELFRKGCPGGLGKIVMGGGRDGFVVQRLRLADVEVAVDDAEELIRQQLGFMPDIISMTGTPFGAQAARVPYKDARGVIHLWYPIEQLWGHLNRKPGPCESPECADYSEVSQ